MERHGQSGFSLLEALIAATLFAVAIITLLHLVLRSAVQAARTEHASVGIALAQAKLEELRGLTLRYDPAGARLDDPGLAPTAADAHLNAAFPSADTLNRFGEPVPAGAPGAYDRAWSITAPAGDHDRRLLTVCVTPSDALRSRVDSACVWSVRTRQP